MNGGTDWFLSNWLNTFQLVKGLGLVDNNVIADLNKLKPKNQKLFVLILLDQSRAKNKKKQNPTAAPGSSAGSRAFGVGLPALRKV